MIPGGIQQQHQDMKQPHPIDRRDFLRLTALGFAGASFGLAGRAAEGSSVPKKIPVAVQLYSVREACKQDFPGTLASLSLMGYRAVEFAGYWARSAADIRKMLDENGLMACGAHTPYEDVRPDKLQATIDFNQTLGNKFIIVPDMSGETRQAWLDRCSEFNALAARLGPLGMSIGYHSHWHDFHPVEGEAPWEIFGENTRPEVILQLDTSNCRDGGGDPLAELRKFPGRTRSIHIKPSGAGPEAVIGEDKIDWAAIFEFCETKGGTQCYVMEHESSKNPVDAMRRTYAALKTFGKV
jgi:sugar phosphate isomerase/epimerase